MSGFSGINNFGSLTTQNGTRVDYKYLLEKYDADGNGEISKDEFNTAIKEEKLDKKIKELDDKTKNSISHRANAISQFIKYLKENNSI